MYNDASWGFVSWLLKPFPLDLKEEFVSLSLNCPPAHFVLESHENGLAALSKWASHCKQLVGFVLGWWTEQRKKKCWQIQGRPKTEEVGKLRKLFSWVNWGDKGTQQEQKGHPPLLNNFPKNRTEKEEVPFASGNLINCFRKRKSVHTNGAVIDSWFSLQCPSGDKVHSTVV